jgi:tyrosyl-tRNA synthetase
MNTTTAHDQHDLPALRGEMMTIIKLLVDIGMAQSRGEAKRLIKQGAIYLNNERVSDPNRIITINDTLPKRVGN